MLTALLTAYRFSATSSARLAHRYASDAQLALDLYKRIDTHHECMDRAEALAVHSMAMTFAALVLS